jgi:protein gp37
MGAKTGIQWCDATWNPWQGCHPVSSGCAHCYMFREKQMYGQRPATVVRSKDATFHSPLHWRESRRILVCSWSDFFVEEADPWRAEAWAIIDRCPQHTFIIPTKRIRRAPALLPWGNYGAIWPNVWLLVSASTQREAGEEIIRLLQIRAAVRGVSLEPLLEDVNLCGLTDGHVHYNALAKGLLVADRLDWVIVAGESGGPPERALIFASFRGARGWRPKADCVQWVRGIRDQCQAAGVPLRRLLRSHTQRRASGFGMGPA